jgi:two-component system, LuxR family, response regulator FixJ
MGRYDRIKPDDFPPSSVTVRAKSNAKAGQEAGRGLSYIHVIDSDEAGKRRLHSIFAGRGDVVVLSYVSTSDFLARKEENDGGCIILVNDTHDDEAQGFINLMAADRRYASVVLSSDTDVRHAVAAMKAGAMDFLSRSCSPAEVWSSVDEVLDRLRTVKAANVARFSARERIRRLSSRERDVLRGLVQGRSNKEIAIELQISPRTIEIYRAHMMEKLGVRSLSEALQYALIAGLHCSLCDGTQENCAFCGPD